jgi:hypothetical protein
MEIFKTIYALGYCPGLPGDRNDSKGNAHVFCLRRRARAGVRFDPGALALCRKRSETIRLR